MNSIQRIDEVFTPELLRQVTQVINQVPWRYGWASNKNIEFTHWNHTFAPGGALNSLDISHSLSGVMAEAWQHIQLTCCGPKTLLRCYANTHTFGVEGYPHTDSRRSADKTMVIYMSPHWQRDWGGETTIYNADEIVHSELPRYNRGLVFSGSDWHSARAVTRICPAQRITLMFKYAERNLDPQRDRLQSFLTLIGADRIKHSGRSLWTHLLTVYDILRAHGYTTEICAAGGLHSIFGTNAFKTALLAPAQRTMVVNTIGAAATEYVELFSSIQRPSTLEAALKNNTLVVHTRGGSPRTLTLDQLNILCAIEASNLSDQKSLKNYPHIAQFLRKPNEK